MNPLTKNTIMILAAWSGPVFVLTYLIFWIGLGHNLPPPNFMAMTGAELVNEYYGKYTADIKLGMTVTTFVGLLYLLWSACLASIMAEKSGPTLFSNLELAGGLLTGWLLAFCPAIWLSCAVFVNVVDPDIILMVHGFTWFMFDMTYMITGVQLLGIGLWTVFHKEQSFFPAWAGWSALAVGVIFLPLTLIPYVTSGPFTVAGIWNFYIVFGTWGFMFFSVYSYYLLKELNRQRRELIGATHRTSHTEQYQRT
ncbi:hypothetical protein [Halioxenophilus aromaticivorans]|uniref:DUF998 domain-containing protein n=1 Tax=Halioxenophilus aromaticivorans TaxID=1306992 RepID=A0AAV3TX92_9ALTE